MIIDKVRRHRNLSGHIAWNELKRFQNIAFVSDEITRLHSVPAKHAPNVKTQAANIRFCLMQAREYFLAAGAVSSATKPVLLYYGMMSLALAELLMKQDGDSSLERAREKNRHHGLTFHITGDPREGKLASSAAALKAKPLVLGSGNRSGTFDLWHLSAREAPACVLRTTTAGGVSTVGATVAAIGGDVRLPLLPVNGITLLDCFQCIPSMQIALRGYAIKPCLARAKIEEQWHDNGRQVMTIWVHPTDPADLEELDKRFVFPASRQPFVTIKKSEATRTFVLDTPVGRTTDGAEFPHSFQSELDEVSFLLGDQSLNEFGYLYVASYILGNYARYHPDAWILDVERCSELAVISEVFMNVIEERAPVLALNELARAWHVF